MVRSRAERRARYSVHVLTFRRPLDTFPPTDTAVFQDTRVPCSSRLQSEPWQHSAPSTSRSGGWRVEAAATQSGPGIRIVDDSPYSAQTQAPRRPRLRGQSWFPGMAVHKAPFSHSSGGRNPGSGLASRLVSSELPPGSPQALPSEGGVCGLTSSSRKDTRWTGSGTTQMTSFGLDAFTKGPCSKYSPSLTSWAVRTSPWGSGRWGGHSAAHSRGNLQMRVSGRGETQHSPYPRPALLYA